MLWAWDANAPCKSWSFSIVWATHGGSKTRTCYDRTVAGACRITTRRVLRARHQSLEGKRTRWYGWASNPGGGVKRFLVGSTPAAFRHERLPLAPYNVQQHPELAFKYLI